MRLSMPVPPRSLRHLRPKTINLAFPRFAPAMPIPMRRRAARSC